MVRSHLRDENTDVQAMGWRLWRIAELGPDDPVLHSTDRDFVWDDRQTRAACVPPATHVGVSDWYRSQRQLPEHASPAPVCGCGIFAYWSRADAIADDRLGVGVLKVVGPVEASERVLTGPDGFRAEAARMLGPLELFGECAGSRDDNHACGEPSIVSKETGMLRCSAHGQGGGSDTWGPLAGALWDLSRQLERRYQIDVSETLSTIEVTD